MYCYLIKDSMKKLQFITMCVALFGVTCVSAQKIEGKIYDKKTNVLLANSEVNFLNDKGQSIAKVKTNKEGLFEYDAKDAKSIKSIATNAPGYYDSDFFTKPFQELLFVNFAINPVSDKSGIQFTTSYLVDEAAKRVSPFDHSMNNGKKISVEGSRNTSKALEFKVSENSSTQLPYFYYDFNSSYLNENNKIIADKVFLLLEKNPSNKLKIQVYLDTQNDVNYNKWLTERRAERIIDYLVAKGVNRSRIDYNIKDAGSYSGTQEDKNINRGTFRRCDFYLM